MLTYSTVYDGKSRNLTIWFQSSLSYDFDTHKACTVAIQIWSRSVPATALIQLLYDHSRFGFISVVQEITKNAKNQHLLKFMF